MKTFFGKRLVSLLLALVMVLGLVPVVATPKTEAATPNYATLKSTIQGLQYPMATTSYWAKGSTSTMDGIYLIVSTQQNSSGLNYRTLDPARPEEPSNDKTYIGYAVQNTEKLNDNDMIGATRDSYSFIRGTATSFSIQRIDRSGYWKFEDMTNTAYYAALRIRGVDNHNKFYIDAQSGRYHIIRDKEHNWYLHSNSWTFRASKGWAPQKTDNENQFWICKVNEEAFYLRDALHDAMAYLIDNSTGRYPAEMYEAFLLKAEEATNYYKSIMRTRYDSISSAEAKRHKDELYESMGKLKLNDTTLQYIDIPIEVLDFRGDGFLFESKSTWTSPYSLSCDPADKNDPRFPGKYTKTQEGGNVQDYFYIDGLVEPNLVGGKVVYTKKTVDYIAYHLNQKTDLKAPSDKMNRAFYDKVMYGNLTYDATNGYNATINKCKDGMLSWGQISSCHDLAYYMLSHIWTKATDIIGTDTLANNTANSYTYNIPVPELSNLRLFKNGENYSFNSGNASIGYDNGHIYNDGTYRQRNDPWFRPVTDRGFESPSLYGNRTEGNSYMPEVNYCFSLHAHGSFVYTEDSDLFFSFGGDDDVYFFINGKLVCDIGGIHGHISKQFKLNELVKAGTLSLKEGQICRFDMFYMDRHTTGINMNLSTNMKIMDESVITEKTQYDPTTGQELPDGAALNTGAEVGYTFGLTNRRSGPLKDVRFADSKLGVTLDVGQGRVELNGQAASELTLTYTTCDIDSKELYTGTPTVCQSYAAIQNLIKTATNAYTTAQPLVTGSYVYTPRDETELREILSWGVPANCKLSIRGIKHTLTAGEFINSLSTLCTPMEYDSVQNVVKALDSVSGAASCRSVGMDLTGVNIISPYRVVLDYGKSVDIDLRKTERMITREKGISLQYVGATFDRDSHGVVRAKEPLNLFFKAAGQTHKTDMGTYLMTTANTLRFTPKFFMNEVDAFCAVYKVTIADQPNFVAYLFSAIEIVPAAMVYYEAEDLADVELFYEEITDTATAQGLSYAETKDTSTARASDPWGTKEDPNYPNLTVIQDQNYAGNEIYYPNYTGDNEVLFFGFENTAEDQARYNSPVYGYQNFDDPAKASSYWYYYGEKNVSSLTVDNNIEGTLTVVAKDLLEGTNVPHDTQYPDIYFDVAKNGTYTSPVLNYNPAKAEVYQVRFKMKNLEKGHYIKEGTSTEITAWPYAIIQYTPKNGGRHYDSQFTTVNAICEENLNGDTYITVRGYFSKTSTDYPAFSACEAITNIRFFFGGMENNPAWDDGTLTVDYIYIGPEAKAPVDASNGRDTSYSDDPLLSNGKSLFVEGKGVRTDANPNPKNLSEIKFEFTGTGFDIISRTGPRQANIRVEIYTDDARNKDCRLSGTAVNLKGEMELYQIPVYSKHDLPYGTYYVSIMVSEAKSYPMFPALSRGGEFYLDAIRVYDPIDVSAGVNAVPGSAAAIAYSTYCADGEAHGILKELREILIPADDFHVLDGSTTGAIFVDYSKIPEVTVAVTTPDGDVTDETIVVPTAPGLEVDDHVSHSIVTYAKIGPNNETYLGQQQLVSFKLVVYSNEIPARVDIGCKTIDDTGSNLRASVVKEDRSTAGVIVSSVKSSTAQFYSLPLWEDQFTEGTYNGKPCYYTYIQIENTTPKNENATDENVLSITDIKIGYSQEPTPKTGSTGTGGNGTGGSASGSGIKSFRGETGNGSAELPVDEFVPVDFVVDHSVAEIVKEELEERFDPECKHLPGPWHTVEGQNDLRQQSCILCGETLAQEDVPESAPAAPELKFLGTTVSLQSKLAIHYKVEERFFTELGFTDPYIVVSDNGVETVIRDYTLENGTYSFTYRDVAPHRIGDTVTATLYAYYGDTLCASAPGEYSVASYCYNMLNKFGANESCRTLRTLLVDLLLYGAESQKFTRYKTETLCTARLTEEQLAWATELSRELVSHRDEAYETVDAPTVQWLGAGLNLQDSVAVRFKIAAEDYEGLEVKITLEGTTYTVKSEDFDHRADGVYVHFTELNATQMSEPIYVAAYREGVQVSHTFCYSIESYAYAKQTDTAIPYLASLVERMMCYGDSCKAFMGK